MINRRGWDELRPMDVLARDGGEQFGVLLPDCDVVSACATVDRLRAVVPGATTCSAGVAIWRPGLDGDALVAGADRALYRAKHGGRNRTEVAAAERRDVATPG